MKKITLILVLLLTSFLPKTELKATNKNYTKVYDWGEVNIQANLINGGQQLELISNINSKQVKTFERANIVLLYDTYNHTRFDTKCIPSEFEKDINDRKEKYGDNYTSCFNKKYHYIDQFDNLNNAFSRIKKNDTYNRLKFGFNQFALGTSGFLDGPIADKMKLLPINKIFGRDEHGTMKNRNSGIKDSEIVEVVKDFKKNPNGKNIIYIVSNFWQYNDARLEYHGDHIADINKYSNDIDMVIPIDVSGVEERDEHYYEQIGDQFFFYDIYNETKARKLAHNAEIIDGIDGDDVGKILENHITNLLMKDNQPIINNLKMTISNGNINLVNANQGVREGNSWRVDQYKNNPKLEVRHLLNKNKQQEFGEIDLEVNGITHKIYINDILNTNNSTGNNTNKEDISNNSSENGSIPNSTPNDSNGGNNKNNSNTNNEPVVEKPKNENVITETFKPKTRELVVYQNSKVFLNKAITNLESGMEVVAIEDYDVSQVRKFNLKVNIMKNQQKVATTTIAINVLPLNIKKIVSYTHFPISWNNVIENKLSDTNVTLVDNVNVDQPFDKSILIKISNNDSEINKNMSLIIKDLVIKPPHLYSFMELNTSDVFPNLDPSHRIEWIDKYEYSNFDQNVLNARLITNTNEYVIEVPIYRLPLNLGEAIVVNDEEPKFNHADPRLSFKIKKEIPSDDTNGVYLVDVYYDNKLVDTLEVPYKKIKIDFNKIETKKQLEELCPQCKIENNYVITPNGNKYPISLNEKEKNISTDSTPNKSASNYLNDNNFKSNKDHSLNKIDKEKQDLDKKDLGKDKVLTAENKNEENVKQVKPNSSLEKKEQPNNSTFVAMPSSSVDKKLDIKEIIIDKNGKISNLDVLKQKYPGYEFKLLEMIDTKNPHRGRTRLLIKHPDNTTSTQWVDYVIQSDKVENPGLPSTGSQLFLATLIGGGLVIAGIVIVIFVKKKDKDNPYNY